MEPAGTEIIRAPLEHCEREISWQNSLKHWEILFGQLLLQVDGVRGDDCLLRTRLSVEDCRDQISQAFAHTRACLNHEVLSCLQRAYHRHRHLLLRQTMFKILRVRQQPARPEDGLHLPG